MPRIACDDPLVTAREAMAVGARLRARRRSGGLTRVALVARLEAGQQRLRLLGCEIPLVIAGRRTV